MSKRTPQRQSKHDRKVKQIAQQLEREGWNVEADISGYRSPEGIGKRGRIPDIRATKAGAERIIEVETPSTMQKDKEQHETFRRSVGQKKRATFRIEVAK